MSNLDYYGVPINARSFVYICVILASDLRHVLFKAFIHYCFFFLPIGAAFAIKFRPTLMVSAVPC